VFDHTSVLRFLERWTGVREDNISAWRRSICGDLTSCFDFASPDPTIPLLPDTAVPAPSRDANESKLPKPSPPPLGQQVAPTQTPARRPLVPCRISRTPIWPWTARGDHLDGQRGERRVQLTVYAHHLLGVDASPHERRAGWQRRGECRPRRSDRRLRHRHPRPERFPAPGRRERDTPGVEASLDLAGPRLNTP